MFFGHWGGGREEDRESRNLRERRGGRQKRGDNRERGSEIRCRNQNLIVEWGRGTTKKNRAWATNYGWRAWLGPMLASFSPSWPSFVFVCPALTRPRLGLGQPSGTWGKTEERGSRGRGRGRIKF
ncbi:hypothetical protein AMTRI_Chr07g25880 [Amborella trichopoda]